MIVKAKQNVLFVQGSIKGTYELEFEKALEEIVNSNPDEDIIVDMHGVKHMNSYALGAIIRFKKAMIEKQIMIRNPSEQVMSLLQVTNLDKIIKVLKPRTA